MPHLIQLVFLIGAAFLVVLVAMCSGGGG